MASHGYKGQISDHPADETNRYREGLLYYKKLSNLVCFIEEAVASARRKYSWLSEQVETILADLIPLVQ